MSGARRWGAVWTLLVATSGLYFLSDNTADNDLWVHLRVGLDVLEVGVPRLDSYSYTAAGGPWIDHEWLLHALFGVLYRIGGGPALLLFKLVVGLATLALLARSVARQAESVHVRGVVLVLTAAVLARGFAVRPQIVTYFFVAALWAFLDEERWRDSHRRWLLVPLFMLWANLHAGVLLGLAITGLCAGWLCFSRPREGLLLGLVVVLGTVGALLFNPYGLGYAAYVWRELGAPHPITEWQPTAFEPAQATFFLLGAALLLSVLFLRPAPQPARRPSYDWRERGWQVVLAAGLFLAALLQQRHTPAFALCAAPVVAAGLCRLVDRLNGATTWRLSPAAQSVLMVGIGLVATVQVAAVLQRLGRDRLQIVYTPADYPVGAVRQLAATGAAANLAVPLEWGGYVLWHLAPRVRVSLDGRFATVYPHGIVEQNFAFFGGRDDWKKLIQSHPTNAVLAPTGAVPPIQSSAGWRRVYADETATIIAREDSALAQAPPGTVDDRSPVGIFP